MDFDENFDAFAIDFKTNCFSNTLFTTFEYKKS